MATIYDVAQESGFSSATVSKVFNHYAGVNSLTKEKVLIAAKKIGYIPNISAQTLVTNKSWLIGVIFKEDLHQGLVHPHFGGILESFKASMEKSGYDIIFLNKNFSDLELRYLEHCRYRNVDGVLLASSPLPEKEAAAIEKAGFKCVSVENDYRNIPTVISDNYGGTKQILNYLYTLGHKKIAMVIPPLKSLAGRERFEGYKIFLKNHNLVFDENLVVECDEYTDESAKIAIERLLNKCLDNFPTAIFAGYDKIAFIIERTLLARGYFIPNDISVVGFDDLEMARSVTPTLTTVYQKRKEIGEEAARIMLKRLEGNDSFDTNTITRIPTGLRIRNSTCRARNN
ncbi:MAG: LacI family DNA-binding transcriptional regulator [Spirochaetaceae bacterium]|nr:LacI family DNA-binding transcriptional regulator [Spirochaetaceae bacterium]